MKQDKINWEEVKSKIQKAQSSFEKNSNLSEDRVKAIYQKRAEQLLKRSSLRKISNKRDILCFVVGSETYGIEIEAVAEILPMKDVVQVPGSAKEFLGVVQVRGEVKAILKLDVLLGLPEISANFRGFLVLLRHPKLALGMRVESLGSVISLDELEWALAEKSIPANASPYVKGVCLHKFCLLNLERIFENHILWDKDQETRGVIK